jgi:hypothetical protein
MTTVSEPRIFAIPWEIVVLPLAESPTIPKITGWSTFLNYDNPPRLLNPLLRGCDRLSEAGGFDSCCIPHIYQGVMGFSLAPFVFIFAFRRQLRRQNNKLKLF